MVNVGCRLALGTAEVDESNVPKVVTSFRWVPLKKWVSVGRVEKLEAPKGERG